MEVHCLSSQETEGFLAHLMEPDGIIDERLKTLEESARCWEVKLVGLTIFIARHAKKHNLDIENIERLYNLDSEMDFDIEEGSDELVNMLLRSKPDEISGNLDEHLLEVLKRCVRYDYTKTLRY